MDKNKDIGPEGRLSALVRGALRDLYPIYFYSMVIDQVFCQDDQCHSGSDLDLPLNTGKRFIAAA